MLNKQSNAQHVLHMVCVQPALGSDQSASGILSVLKVWIDLGQPGMHVPPIIAMYAIFNVQMSCDASVT